MEICCNRRVASKKDYICVADRKGNYFTVSKSHSTHDSACDIKNLGWLTYDSNDKHKVKHFTLKKFKKHFLTK